MSTLDLDSEQNTLSDGELDLIMPQDDVVVSLKKYISEQLLPIKKALNLIFTKLEISQSFFIPEQLNLNIERPPSKRIKLARPKMHSIAMNNMALKNKEKGESEVKEECISIQIKSDSLNKYKQKAKQVQYRTPVPRGNNTTYNPTALPSNAYMEEVKPQNRQEWLKIYEKVKCLLQSKKVRGERGWFDFQKKILLQYVTIGTQFGINPYQLTKQLGISHSSFKRWRKYFK